MNMLNFLVACGVRDKNGANALLKACAKKAILSCTRVRVVAQSK